jgi:hypothetical protein
MTSPLRSRHTNGAASPAAVTVTANAAIALLAVDARFAMDTGRSVPVEVAEAANHAPGTSPRVAWTERLGEALANLATPPIIIARGCGSEPCVRIANHVASRILGALLLAPEVPPPLLRFSPEFGRRLPVPTLVVGHRAARDLQRAQWAYWARVWGADFLTLDGDWLDGPLAAFSASLPCRLLVQRLAHARGTLPPRTSNAG